MMTNVRYRIQGVTGQQSRPSAEVQNIPLWFNKQDGIWRLNAGIIDSPPADVILGTNFMHQYNAIINIKSKQVALENEKTKQLVVLPLTMNLMVNASCMPVNIVEPMDVDIPEDWRCLKGLTEYTCIRGFMPENDVQPCERCKF